LRDHCLLEPQGGLSKGRRRYYIATPPSVAVGPAHLNWRPRTGANLVSRSQTLYRTLRWERSRKHS